MPRLGRRKGDVLPVDEYSALCGKSRVEEAADEGEQRRLAGAGRAHHRQHLAAGDMAVEGHQRPPAEADRDAVEAEPAPVARRV